MFSPLSLFIRAPMQNRIRNRGCKRCSMNSTGALAHPDNSNSVGYYYRLERTITFNLVEVKTTPIRPKACFSSRRPKNLESQLPGITSPAGTCCNRIIRGRPFCTLALFPNGYAQPLHSLDDWQEQAITLIYEVIGLVKHKIC